MAPGGRRCRPRPLFICANCGRPITKLYFNYGSLKCRRCANAVYASQCCDKHSRPILQALRLQTYLKLKTYIRQSNRLRLKARIPKAPSIANVSAITRSSFRIPITALGVQCIGARGKDDASRGSLASFAARACACAAGYCVSFARALAACGDVIESMAARGNLFRYWPLLLCFALPQVVVLLWIWLVR
jgi:hypothetical protein